MHRHSATMSLPIALLLVFLVLFVSPAQADDQAVPPGARAEYAIGIEDVLRITVWEEADLTMTVKVRPDGRITLPLVNDIVVEGLTTQELRNQITRRLATFVRDPNVSVLLEESNSFRVYVLGEVNQQGVLQFYRRPRLLQALASAGGLTQFSSKQITVFREIDGKEQRIEVNYKKLIAGEGSEENVHLMPGDTLVVK